MNDSIRKHPLIKGLCSYSIGIVSMLFMMLLLVIGTLYQEHYGIFRAKRMFFDSWVFLYPLADFIRSLPSALQPRLQGIADSGIAIPLPGNRLLTLVLFVNLLSATIFRMRFRKQIIGVYIVHAGILILIGGAFVTTFFAYESYMRLPEGEAANFSSRYHKKEIALTRTVEPGIDEVISVANLEHMSNGTDLLKADHPAPFTLRLLERHSDSMLDNDDSGAYAREHNLNLAPATKLKVIKADLSANPDASPLVLALELKPEAGGEPMRFLLSDMLLRPIEIVIGGETWRCELRDYRHYYPFSVYLRDFQRDMHPGTGMAAAYSSDVAFLLPEENINKDIRIYMNHPLRYGTCTFYQQSFEQGDKVSILAVVNNPGMTIPYIATIVIAIGLLVQFISSLRKFAVKPKEAK